MTIYTNDEKETMELAKEMAKKAAPGTIICLDGDLGVYKGMHFRNW